MSDLISLFSYYEKHVHDLCATTAILCYGACHILDWVVWMPLVSNRTIFSLCVLHCLSKTDFVLTTYLSSFCQVKDQSTNISFSTHVCFHACVLYEEKAWGDDCVFNGFWLVPFPWGVDLFAMLAKHQWSFQSWCDFSLGSVKCGCQQSPLRSAVRDGDAGWGEFVV